MVLRNTLFCPRRRKQMIIKMNVLQEIEHRIMSELQFRPTTPHRHKSYITTRVCGTHMPRIYCWRADNDKKQQGCERRLFVTSAGAVYLFRLALASAVSTTMLRTSSCCIASEEICFLETKLRRTVRFAAFWSPSMYPAFVENSDSYLPISVSLVFPFSWCI